MNQSSHDTIWALFIEGERSAYTSLFKFYYPKLYGYGLKISANTTLTEDCLQDFFVHLYENKNSMGKIKSVDAYLFVSFRRALLKVMNKEKTFTDFENHQPSAYQFAFSAEELAIQKEYTSLTKTVVASILNELSNREREVVYLKYYSNLKTKDIADVMDISYQSVLNTLQKAFAKLRKRSEDEVIKSVLKKV